MERWLSGVYAVVCFSPGADAHPLRTLFLIAGSLNPPVPIGPEPLIQGGEDGACGGQRRGMMWCIPLGNDSRGGQPGSSVRDGVGW